MTNPATSPNNSSTSASGASIITNNGNANNVFKQTVVISSAGAISNILLIGQSSPLWLASKLSTFAPDFNTYTLSSSLSAANSNDYAEMCEYLRNNGMHITKITMNTSNTAVYSGSLYWGELAPNGFPTPIEIALPGYATALGAGGYDSTLTISDNPLAVSKNFYLYLSSIPAGTTLNITYAYDFIGNALVGVPANS